MSLTGTSLPIGTAVNQETTWIDSAPELYFADTRGSYRFGPDADGFYWGLSGTATYPVYKVGCYQDFKWGDNVTMNEIRCDVNGLQGTIQKRQSLKFSFTLQALFPLSVLTHLLRWGAVTTTASTSEKVGIGDVTRKNSYWRLYLTKIYDEEDGDWISVTMHKVQFMDTWEIASPWADRWNVAINGVAYIDTTKPAAQELATVIRSDPSAIP
jgi:hypothetical protein